MRQPPHWEEEPPLDTPPITWNPYRNQQRWGLKIMLFKNPIILAAIAFVLFAIFSGVQQQEEGITIRRGKDKVLDDSSSVVVSSQSLPVGSGDKPQKTEDNPKKEQEPMKDEPVNKLRFENKPKYIELKEEDDDTVVKGTKQAKKHKREERVKKRKKDNKKEELESMPTSICGRKIPINLADKSTWPTPELATITSNDDISEVVLIKKDEPFGLMGKQLSSFFHALDYAHDTKTQVYVTKDSWFFETIFHLFYGGSKENNNFWGALQTLLGVYVINSDKDLTAISNTVKEYKNPKQLYEYTSSELDAETIRNHRDTILRKLFQYPTVSGDVCALVDQIIMNSKIGRGTPKQSTL
jgi:hypothetical protein